MSDEFKFKTGDTIRSAVVRGRVLVTAIGENSFLGREDGKTHEESWSKMAGYNWQLYTPPEEKKTKLVSPAIVTVLNGFTGGGRETFARELFAKDPGAIRDGPHVWPARIVLKNVRKIMPMFPGAQGGDIFKSEEQDMEADIFFEVPSDE